MSAPVILDGGTGGCSGDMDPTSAAPSTYLARVSEVVPGTSPATAMADGLFLCEQILTGEHGAGSAADLVRSHFADRVDLDDGQVVAILQATLSDACPERGWLERLMWR